MEYAYRSMNFSDRHRPPQPLQATESSAPEADRSDEAKRRNRVFEVIEGTAEVRAEPHPESGLRGKKNKGGRLIGSAISMNGWVKLAGGDGWIESQTLQGVDGRQLGLVGPTILAVEQYHPQGLCCLEVVFEGGVPVMESESPNAQAIELRKHGELVFAQMQNFEGLVKLWGEQGWMAAVHKNWGRLLRLCTTNGVDIWALADVWTAARRTRNGSLSTQDIIGLKHLERTALVTTSSLYEHGAADNMKELVEAGLLCREDLLHSRLWTFQRLFAGVLKQIVTEDVQLRELLKDFEPGKPVPPSWDVEGRTLLLAEDKRADGEQFRDEDEAAAGWNEGRTTESPQLDFSDSRGTVPLDFEGKTVFMFPDTSVFDPMDQRIIGFLNTETLTIEPVPVMMPSPPTSAPRYNATTAPLVPDGRRSDSDEYNGAGFYNHQANETVLGSASQEVIGSYNRETHEMKVQSDPRESPVKAQVAWQNPVIGNDVPLGPDTCLDDLD